MVAWQLPLTKDLGHMLVAVEGHPEGHAAGLLVPGREVEGPATIGHKQRQRSAPMEEPPLVLPLAEVGHEIADLPRECRIRRKGRTVEERDPAGGRQQDSERDSREQETRHACLRGGGIEGQLQSIRDSSAIVTTVGNDRAHPALLVGSPRPTLDP